MDPLKSSSPQYNSDENVAKSGMNPVTNKTGGPEIVVQTVTQLWAQVNSSMPTEIGKPSTLENKAKIDPNQQEKSKRLSNFISEVNERRIKEFQNADELNAYLCETKPCNELSVLHDTLSANVVLLRDTDSEGKTPLSKAVESNNLMAVTYILGELVQFVDAEQETTVQRVLDKAVELQSVSMIRALFEPSFILGKTSSVVKNAAKLALDRYNEAPEDKKLQAWNVFKELDTEGHNQK